MTALIAVLIVAAVLGYRHRERLMSWLVERPSISDDAIDTAIAAADDTREAAIRRLVGMPPHHPEWITTELDEDTEDMFAALVHSYRGELR